MNIEYVEWRNIKSFGNKLQRVDLSPEGGLWLITGKNGNGKSTFLELPKLGYYGKLDNFKKNEISNRLNQHGFIKLGVRTSPDTFVTIERSFSPSDLKVEKNGEDIGKAGITDYQTYIDLEVTGLPYHIFSNIISLSINDFKSFISMTPHDKRIIIDKLFAMEVINKMNELIKRDLRDIKMNMDLYDREIMSLKANIDVAIKELQKLKTKVNEDNSTKILDLSNKLQEYKPKLLEGYEKRKLWESKKEEIIKSRNIFREQKIRVAHDIKHLQEQNHLFSEERCPTCATPFNDTRFDLVKGQLQEDIARKTDELERLKTEESKYEMGLQKFNEGLAKINAFIIQVQTTYNTIESEMTRLKMDKPQEFSSIQNIISDSTTALTSKNEEKVKFDEEYKYLAILEQLYSDAGVKKKILENYLPILNKEIEYTLDELHFPYSLSFNSDFDPYMTHLGIEISVDTLSTGESKRVDLAVLISIIRMLKRKYAGLNIFMLDEVLSSIDGDGIYDIIGLLQKIAKEMNMNIFIINHSPLPVEHFDFTVHIEKNSGFSDIVVNELNEDKNE